MQGRCSAVSFLSQKYEKVSGFPTLADGYSPFEEQNCIFGMLRPEVVETS